MRSDYDRHRLTWLSGEKNSARVIAEGNLLYRGLIEPGEDCAPDRRGPHPMALNRPRRQVHASRHDTRGILGGLQCLERETGANQLRAGHGCRNVNSISQYQAGERRMEFL